MIRLGIRRLLHPSDNGRMRSLQAALRLHLHHVLANLARAARPIPSINQRDAFVSLPIAARTLYHGLGQHALRQFME